MSDRVRTAVVATLAVLAVLTAVAGMGGIAVFALWATQQTNSSPPPEPHVEAPARSTDAVDDLEYVPWDRNPDGTPVRWDPCEPIVLVVNPAGGPDGWLERFDEAIDVLRDHGVDLVIEGHVDERPDAERRAHQPDRYGHRWAPVLVAWSTPGESGLGLRATDRALAVPIAVGTSRQRNLVTAQVVFNADRTRAPHALRLDGDDREDGWVAVFVHELLHVVGLDHVDDPAQLMHHAPGAGPVELGDGDLAGLRTLTSGGCVPAPTPGPVEISRDEPVRR
ncbi:MAG: hypothetical protein WD575_01330 [Nitriliruptoraceae bacterium]